MMKALQIIAPGQVEWRDVRRPEAGAGEVLVKVAAVTTCPHWDIHLMSGEPMFPGVPLPYPYTLGQPGHEMAGEVVAVGAGVSDFAVGDRVAAWRDAGSQRQGCYAQFIPCLAENLLKTPTTLAPAEVASLELAMCVQVTFQQLQPLGGVTGKQVGISGLGPAGLIAVQMARAQGAQSVVAIDPVLTRHSLAQTFGADRVITPDGLPKNVAGAEAFDLAIDCTGLPVSIQALMACSKEAVAIFGVLRAEVAFGWDHWRRGLHLLGYARHNRVAAEEALRLVVAGQVQLAPLATHELPLTRYAEGVDLLRNKEAIKVRFLPWG